MGSIQQIMMGLTCLAAAFVFGRYVHNKPAPESQMQTVAVQADSNGFLPLTSTSTPSSATAEKQTKITSFAELTGNNLFADRHVAKFPPAPKLPTASELRNSFDPSLSAATNASIHDHAGHDHTEQQRFAAPEQLTAAEQNSVLGDQSQNTPFQNESPAELIRRPVVPNFSELASRFDNGPLALPPMDPRATGPANSGQPIHEAERTPQLLNSVDIAAPQLEVRRPGSFQPKKFAQQERQPNSSSQHGPNIGIMQPANQFADAVDRFEEVGKSAMSNPQPNWQSNQVQPQQEIPYENVQAFPRNNTRLENRQDQRQTRRPTNQTNRNTGQKLVPGVDIDSYFAQRTAIEMYDKSNASNSEFGSNYLNQNTDKFAVAKSVIDRDTQSVLSSEESRPLAVDTSRLKQWRMSTEFAPPEPDLEQPPESCNEPQCAQNHPTPPTNSQNQYVSRNQVGSGPEFASPPMPSGYAPAQRAEPTRAEQQRIPTVQNQYVNRGNRQNDTAMRTILNRPNGSATGNIRSYNESLVFKPFRNQDRRFATPQPAPANANIAVPSNIGPAQNQPSRQTYKTHQETGLTQVTRPNSLRRNSNAIGGEEKIYRTKPGDTLQSIAAQQLGMPDYYLAIYLANRDQLQTPAFVPIDIDLVIPNIN